MFLSETGHRIKTVANIELMITQTGIKANVRGSVRCLPHNFRHYYTVKNIQLGQDVFTISKLLGHSNLSITQTYIQSLTNEQLITKGLKFSPLINLK
ncbi:tyrosine-type recombinase/integrase [Lactococcus petauri]|uniref:tyrosine-type recombinase/integrase n=1 Tax=Lactococcus petauri TaxID=1940789 RepID=UPI00385503B9